MSGPRATLHATAIAIDGRGLLLLGPAGAGKSDLALRLIDRGAALIADDAVAVTVDRHRLMLSAIAPAAAGRLLVRGIGMVAVPASEPVPAALAITLSPLPPASPGAALPAIDRLALLDGWCVPRLSLDGAAASAPIKVALALHRWGL